MPPRPRLPQQTEPVVLLQYSPEEEDILIGFADRSKCYAWMYQKAYDFFWWVNACFMIPVIILSTIVGTANYAQSRFEGQAATVAPMVIGSISIITAILSTLLQFLKVPESLEGSRQAGLYWGKYARALSFELAKHPSKRRDPKECIEWASAEFDRLMEISPALPAKVIRLFNKEIDHNDVDLILPEIAGEIHHTIKWQPPPGPTATMGETDTSTTSAAAAAAFFSQHGRHPLPSEI